MEMASRKGGRHVHNEQGYHRAYFSQLGPWADLSPERNRWILVTLVFDRVYDPGATDIQALEIAVRDAVARNLEGGSLP